MASLSSFRSFALGAFFVALPLAVGCNGCSTKPKGGSPLQFIAGDAEAVLELRDIGSLIQARQGLSSSFGALLPPAQIESLQKELKLGLGFDPSTAEGLAKAGLPSSGAIAGSLLSNGQGAVWIIPVLDQAKLTPLLEKTIKARVSVDAVRKEKLGTVEVTVYETQFGPDKITVAAYLFTKGFLLVGAGRDSVSLLKAALAVKPETSVLKAAEYSALIKTLDPKWDLRMTSPKGGETLSGALRALSRTVPEARALVRDELGVIKSAGWSANFTKGGLSVQGRLRLTEQGLALSKSLFAPVGEPSPGVKAIGVPETVVFSQIGLNPMALLDLLAPKGSPARTNVDAAAKKAKSDVNVDFNTELMPLLTGHGALALGLGGLDKVSFKTLMGNPRGVLWTAFAIGVKEPAAAVQLEKRLDPGLKARSLEIVPRLVKDTTVRSIRPAGAEATAALVETSTLEGAWLFANEPALMNRVLDNGSAANALGGSAGLYAEVNFRELNKQLSTFRFGDLPILYRSLLAKVMDGLKLLDSAKVRVQPSDDGVKMSAELNIIPVAAAK